MTQKEYLALIHKNKELNEIQLKVDQLFFKYDKKIKQKTNIDLYN